jgi:opacity protein-like surface antigen
MIRRAATALLIAAGLSAVLAGSAVAGSLPAPNSGTISVYVPGTGGAASTEPKYQGLAAFATTGTERLKNPRVWVACYQNGAMVYGAGGSPSETFKLGGDSSLWVLDGGGAASCSAQLYYILNAKGTGEWNGNGPQGGKVVLANTAFAAAA